MHEDTTVVVTRDGWMKRLGEIKDPSTTRVREGDQARWILRGNTRDALALFSNFGVAYVMKVATVPATTGYGEPVQSLLNFKDGERIINAVLVSAPSANGKDDPSRHRARSSCSPAAAAGRRAAGGGGSAERRRAGASDRPLAGGHGRRHGLFLPARPDRDDAQRAPLRSHQGRRRAGRR